jgi:N-acetylmuramic acid 6-phosphate (MurNAc-6-P) etherase
LLGLSAADVAVAVSASGRSTFARDAIDAANLRGSFTIAFVNTADPPLARAGARSVIVDTGKEVSPVRHGSAPGQRERCRSTSFRLP